MKRVLLSIFQRYKMKANHNNETFDRVMVRAVVNISKIQNESKSQHLLRGYTGLLAVVNISKIQNESKSQPFSAWLNLNISCCQYFKDTK